MHQAKEKQNRKFRGPDQDFLIAQQEQCSMDWRMCGEGL